MCPGRLWSGPHETRPYVEEVRLLIQVTGLVREHQKSRDPFYVRDPRLMATIGNIYLEKNVLIILYICILCNNYVLLFNFIIKLAISINNEPYSPLIWIKQSNISHTNLPLLTFKINSSPSNNYVLCAGIIIIKYGLSTIFHIRSTSIV